MAQRPDFTELDAVNRILRSSGEQPVNTLESDGVNDTDQAQAILRETLQEILLEGHNFNTEEREYTADDSGEIALPPNILRVDGVGDDYYSRFEPRGGRLYDLDNTTFEFTKTVTLEVVWWIPFKDIPLQLRYRIADEAARIYQQVSNNDPQVDRYLQEREIRSKVNSSRANIRNTDYVWGTSKNSTGRLISSRRRRGRRY